MTQHSQKSLFLPATPKLSFGSIKNFRFLILETSFLTKKYIKIDSTISLKKQHNALLVTSELKPNLFNSSSKAVNDFSIWLKKFSKPFRKQLLLKGLGFKGNISEDGLWLELKLGFSHLIKVSTQIPELKVAMNNTLLSVEGFEAYKVGNFLKKIKNFKMPDIYKGKGFWYKNEIKVFKEIKKT